MANLSMWWRYKGSISLLLLSVLLDLLFASLAYESIHHWQTTANVAAFFSSLTDFTTDAADVILMAILRSLLIPLFIILAAQVGKPLDELTGQESQNDESGLADSDEKVTAPLLSSQSRIINGDSDKAMKKVVSSAWRTTAYDLRSIDLSSTQGQELLEQKVLSIKRAKIQHGIKMVLFSFDPDSETEQAVLLGLTLLWINVEMILAKKIVTLLTQEEGVLFKDLHPHKLYYDDALFGHWCDLCHLRMKKPRVGYRCQQCNFDLCMQCFSRKNRSRAEGVLRGDKGTKEEIEVSSAGYLMRALKLAKPHWHLIVLACLCLLASSGASLLLPNFQGRILDDVAQMDKSSFATDIRFYIAMTVASGFFGGLRSLCFSVVGSRMANGVRNRLFSSIIIQDIAFFDGTTTGELTSRLSNDSNAMIAPCQTVLGDTLQNTLSLVGGLVMIFYTSWRLSILAITSIGPIIQITRTYAEWSRSVNREIWAALGDASSVATQAFTNIRTIRAFGTENHEKEKYLDATSEALHKGVKDSCASALTYALTNYLDLGTSVLLLWYGGSLAMEDNPSITVGKLITFQLYWNMMNNAYSNLVSSLNAFTRAAGGAQRVLSLMDNLPDIDPDAGKEVVDLKGELRLEHVSFFYQMRPDNPVLRDINLVIPAGKTCALVGRSGGGKSTIVHLLLRFYDPKEGRILLDGEDIRSLNLMSLHHHMAFVAQDTQLFAGTIEENICYGAGKCSVGDMHAAAKLANAHDFIIEFEDGYATRVGERGIRLSGGQKQRIAIARAMLRKARILFLDEATSSLDAESEALVQEALDNLIRVGGCTVILVAHRLSTVVNADKIAVIDKGRIIEQGRHDELVAMGGAYAQLVQRQLARRMNLIEQGKENDANKQKDADVIDKLLDTDDQQNGTQGSNSNSSKKIERPERKESS